MGLAVTLLDLLKHDKAGKVYEEDDGRFTAGPYPDLMEDRVGLDDRVLCFHG